MASEIKEVILIRPFEIFKGVPLRISGFIGASSSSIVFLTISIFEVLVLIINWCCQTEFLVESLLDILISY